MTRLLLDTHIILAAFERRLSTIDINVASIVERSDTLSYASVASLWEIAIKSRLGKLSLKPSLPQLPELLDSLGIAVLVIEASHALADVHPQPPTRDPFDRLLLNQCLVENLRLVTLDRALVAHPLAWQPA